MQVGTSSTCAGCEKLHCAPSVLGRVADACACGGAQVGLLEAFLLCVWQLCSRVLMLGGVVAQVGFLGTVALMVFGGGCAMAHAFTALK